MKRTLLFLGLSLLSLNTVSAEVSQLIFITDPQVIPVGVSSDTITVQTQNSEGVSENIAETNDIVFSSTSQTGEFLSTSGNPVTTTMSKNTANKNFLYRDSASGSHTITVTTTGRTTLKSLSATQQIVVGSSSSGTNTSTTTPPVEEEKKTTTPTPIIFSAHSSPVPLSTTENKIDFEIYAGRDRLASVGNSVVFKVSATKTQNVAEQNITYTWSFGDGAVAQGATVSHAYRFPGNYTVVVNGVYSNKQAVSKLLTTVISPQLTLIRVPGGFEINNKSKSEVNVEDWIISSSKKSFTFPKDTLIIAGGAITFPDEVTGLSQDSVRVFNPLGKLFVSLDEATTSSSLSLVPNQIDTVVLQQIQTKIEGVKSALAQITPKIVPVAPISPVRDIVVKSDPPQETVVQAPGNSDQLASVITAVELMEDTEDSSEKLSWPMKSLMFIKRLFSE